MDLLVYYLLIYVDKFSYMSLVGRMRENGVRGEHVSPGGGLHLSHVFSSREEGVGSGPPCVGLHPSLCFSVSGWPVNARHLFPLLLAEGPAVCPCAGDTPYGSGSDVTSP